MPVDVNMEMKTLSITNSNNSTSPLFLLTKIVIGKPMAKNERIKRNIELKIGETDERRRESRNKMKMRLMGKSKFLKQCVLAKPVLKIILTTFPAVRN
jgi:hypothetical protein